MELIEGARIKAVEAGGLMVSPDWDHDQFNPFVKIYFITEGEGEVTAGKDIIPLLPGRLYLIPSHVSLQMRCRDRMYHYWVHLVVGLEGGLDLLSLTGDSLTLVPENPEVVESQMRRIAELYPAAESGHEMELQGLYRLLLARFINAEGNEGSAMGSRGMAIFQTTLEYIDTNLASPLNNDELAAL